MQHLLTNAVIDVLLSVLEKRITHPGRRVAARRDSQ
jgi:hypothetical protein